jgi:hypothetical protein
MAFYGRLGRGLLVRNRRVAVEDGGGTTILAGPREVTFIAGSVTWTNQPLAETEFLGNQNRRKPYDGTDMTEFRFTAGGAGVVAAASVLRLKADVAGVMTTITGSELSIATMATGVPPVDTGWVALPAQFRIDGTIGVWGEGGNGTADPQFTIVEVEFR